MALVDVDNFYINLLKIKDKEIFIKYCEEENNLIKNSYTTNNSIKTTYTKYRNKCVQLKIKDERRDIIFNTFKLDEEISQSIRENYKLNVSSDLSKLKWIYSVEDYINVSVKLIRSSRLEDNIIGLAALTGRRVAEIGCLAHFKYKNKNTVIFEGQLKARNSREVLSYEIPLLHHAEEVIDTLQKVRFLCDKYNNKTVLFHDRYSKFLSGTVKKHYTNIIEGTITPKSLRACYVIIAYKNFCDGSVAITRYTANILGHSITDNETCNSYIIYRIE
jgi:hypothetical protein